MANTGPTLLRRRLGAELARLRRKAGYTRDGAAEGMGWSVSKMQYIENAKFKRPNQNDIRALLELYGITDSSEQDAVIRLVRESGKRGWWHKYRDVLPNWFESYIGLEADASQFRTYEAVVIPGLLQTEEYARAVIAAEMVGNVPEEIERTVSVRMSRQELLSDSQRRFWVVIDEAALHRNVGGTDVMREQYDRLLAIAELPAMTLQVLPFAGGEYPGMRGPFVILGFLENADPDVVYLENETSSLYLEEDDEIARYSGVFDHLRANALSPADSIALVSRMRREVS